MRMPVVIAITYSALQPVALYLLQQDTRLVWREHLHLMPDGSRRLHERRAVARGKAEPSRPPQRAPQDGMHMAHAPSCDAVRELGEPVATEGGVSGCARRDCDSG